MAADGSIIIKAEVDDKQAQKRLNSLAKKIESTDKEISDIGEKRKSAEEKSVFQAAELDREKEKLQEIKDRLQDIKMLARDKTTPLSDRELAKESIPGVQTELSEQSQRVRMLQAEYNKTASAVERYDAKLIKANENLAKMETEAGVLVQQLSGGNPVVAALDRQFQSAQKSVKKFGKRVNTLFKRVLIFSMFARVFRVFRDEMGLALRSSQEFTTAMSQLKGNLRVAFQPLWQLIIPALTKLVQVASAAVAALARLFAFLSGKSLQSMKDSAQAMTDEANAIGGAGGAAKDAGKQLAAFDEINQLQDNSGGGGGGGSAEPVNMQWADNVSDTMQNILDLVLAIAAGLLTWKIAKHFKADMQTAIGLAIAMGGAVYYIEGFFDAWVNGLDGGNLTQMIIGLSAAMLGLTLVFGKTGAAIGLLVGSIGLLVVGFHDIAKSGQVTGENLASVEVGILGIGIALSLLIGGWIPALIAGLAGLVVGFALTGEHSEEAILGIQNICEGFLKFFDGDFAGGLSLAWEGIRQLFGAGFKTIGDKFHEWDVKITNSVLEFVNGIVAKFEAFFSKIKSLLTALGAAWSNTWSGIFESVKGFANSILEAIENMVNLAVNAINSISIGIPDWVPLVGGKTFSPNLSTVSLPRLASGAVIPPNREFMAVLGDQKSGTNIETPLATMVQAFRQAMSESGSGQVIENVLILDGEVIYRNQKRIAKQHGTSLVGG